jgi:hypothetical protein
MKFRTKLLGLGAALILIAQGAFAQGAGFQFPTSPWNGYAPGVVQCGWLYAANMNTTADQAITISVPSGAYSINAILVSNPSVSLTTASGGVYTGAGKTGVTLVSNAALSGLTTNTANTSGNLLALTLASGAATTNFLAASSSTSNTSTIYFALTTSQGAAATADIRVLCNPLY